MSSGSMPGWPGWETVRFIGRGSFGAVYEIERDVFGETEKAALKVITIPQSSSDIDELYGEGYDDESITNTFRDHLKSIVAEYSLMRKMNGSSYVVNCDDVRYVQHEDGFGWDIFIKMELLTPITKALGKEVTEEQVIRIGGDLCKALILCKRHNIIHRDIKPANIFVSENGDYKLGDFGIAKTVEKTSGGTKIGTYEYMAPEVYRDMPYGHTVDIYSLGMVLYWLLNERRTPFLKMPPELPTSVEKEQARRRRFAGEELPKPAHGSEELKRIILKACAYDPKDRYQSAEEMLRELDALNRIQPADHDKAFTSGGIVIRDKYPDKAEIPAAAEVPVSVQSHSFDTKVGQIEQDSAAAVESVDGCSTAASVDGHGNRFENKSDADRAVPAAQPGKHGNGRLWAILCLAGALVIGFYLWTTRLSNPSAPAGSIQDTPGVLLYAADRDQLRASGTTENGLSWSWDNGVLTISGSGPMDNYSVSRIPWKAYQDNITSVTIERGVTSISLYAFSNCINLKKTIIPDSVTSIGFRAFYNCISLQDITIPESVTSIGSGAFSGCISLISIAIPNSVAEIGNNAFSSCEKLERVSFSTEASALRSIGYRAFSSCIGLTDFAIPKGVSSIESYTFADCRNLNSIAIPVSVNQIGRAAFGLCDKLRNVYYAGTKSQWETIRIDTEIGSYEDNRVYDNRALIYKAKMHFNSDVS